MSGRQAGLSSAHVISVTVGCPSVTVPVLSNRILSICRAASKLSASLMRMPCSAPLPMPTMMAVGVASPSAQGQAMMSTVTKANRPCVKPSDGASVHHKANERRAMPMMAGTNMAAMRSTNRCTGALLPCASCTMRMMWASTVSAPTFSARKRNEPRWLMVPANTCDPSRLATGTGSPLSMLSSMYELPETMVPSTAIRSPGRTETVCPRCRSSMLISRVSPRSSTMVTVRGCSPMSLRMAVEVLPLALSSKSRPNRIKAMMMLAASK